jgi:DNA topoisomerase 2-associated protein PAT1
LHTNSLESIWDDNSAFSALPRSNGSSRIVSQSRVSPSIPSSKFSPFENQPIGAHNQQQQQQRARTLQEIETEMLAKAEQDRKLEREQQLFAQLHQFEQHEQPQRTRQQEFLAQQQLHQQQQRQLLQDEERRRQQPYQQQEQQQQLHRLMQQREQLHQRTPPPRMIPTSQSPRFLEHQRQILLLQQQQELQLQQQQQHLQELQEQLRIEELERRMATQMTLERNRNGSPFNPRRTPIKYTAEIQAAHLFQQQQQQQQQLLLHKQQQQQYRRQGSRSPAVSAPQFPTPLQEGLSYHPQNIQLQQRLLADLAQVDFSRELHGASPAEQEALRMEAMRKIVETEKMEEKRRRKAAKIAHMVVIALLS